MESLKPRKTLVEQVYERILDAICEGGLPAGARVTQDELAAQFEVVQPRLGAKKKLVEAALVGVGEGDAREQEADEAAELVLDGEMPPFDYVLAHPEANLSPAERQELAAVSALDVSDVVGDRGASPRFRRRLPQSALHRHGSQERLSAADAYVKQ